MLGSFVIRSQGRALAAVLVGSILGIIGTAWTLVLPIVVLAVVILRILDAEPRSVTIPQWNS